jgi:hypothetical protein
MIAQRAEGQMSSFHKRARPLDVSRLSGTVRLSKTSFGAVQVQAGSEHYLVKAESWGEEETAVLCRALGFAKWFRYTGPGTNVAFSYDCILSESSLEVCKHEPYGYPVKATARVFCYDSMQGKIAVGISVVL